MRRLLLILAALGLSAIPALCQVQPVAIPGYQFFDDDGSPLAGGKICSYSAGTTTPLATYTDSSGTVTNSNPIILDSAGRATIWFGPASYKLVVRTAGTDNTCSTGSVIRTDDNIPGAGQSVSSNAWSAVTAATNSNSGIFAMSGNTLDLSGATLKVTHGAGAAPTISAIPAYDDTGDKWVFGQNGTAVSFGLASAMACPTHQTVTSPATAIAAAGCAQLAASDLSNGTTGSGAAVLAVGPALIAPSIGGITMTNVPRLIWGGGFGSSSLGALNSVQAIVQRYAPISIDYFSITLDQSYAGCSTYPVFAIYDETASATLSTVLMTASTTVYENTNMWNIAANHTLDIRVATAAGGCSTTPTVHNFSVGYFMQ